MEQQTQQPTHNVDGIPYEATGWSWGAFLLGPIWGVFNRVWISLLVLIPFVGFIMAFVLGAKGGQWAWKQKPWRDTKHFKRAQLNWAIAGAGVWAIIIMIIAAAPSSGPVSVTNDMPTSTTSSESKNSPTFFKMGETIRTRDIEFTVSNASVSNKFRKRYGGTKYPTAGQFVIVDMTIKNVGTEQVHISHDNIKLLDDSGAEYSMDNHLSTLGDKGYFVYEEFNPNSSKKAKLVFDVSDKSLDSFTVFAYPKRHSSTDDAAVIDLIR